MATWVDPVDSQTDPDAPITSDLAKRWDNNVVALAEGASGAPRIQDGALATSVTNAGRNWVANRVITGAWNRTGQLALAKVDANGPNSDSAWHPGDIAPGSSLTPASAVGTTPGPGSGVPNLPGSWRCQGYSDINDVTQWLRIS